MYPVNFPEQNATYAHSKCDDLPACVQRNEEFDTNEVISCWTFTDEEIVKILKDIQAGIRPQIYLDIVGGQPPVALFMRE